MPRNVRTARGEVVDFDAIVIKQQIAQAPMNLDVARRKEFIDSKEGKVRGARKPMVEAIAENLPDPATVVLPPTPEPSKVTDFEPEAAPAQAAATKGPIEAVPVLPERKK